MIVLGYSLALLVGLSLGLLGGGGAILTVPILHYVMGYEEKLAVAMSLVVVGVTSGVGAVTHWRAGTLDVRTVMAFAPPAIVGTLLGTELALRVSDTTQLTVFAVVLLAAAVSMFLGGQRMVELGKASVTRTWAAVKPSATLSEAKGADSARRSLPSAASPSQGDSVPEDGARKRFPLITLVGAAVGLLTGLVGVGGGFLYVPTLVLLGGLAMRRAVGTSLALITVSCITGVIRYHGTLPLVWNTIAIFSAIALVGVALGTRLVRYVSQETLRKGFAVFLLLMGLVVLLVGR